jgi:3'-5' exoribonuclease
MTRRFVDQLADGDTTEDIFLVFEKQFRANRNGVFYIQLELGDRSGKIESRMWNASEPLFRSFDIGDFLLVKGKIQLFQGSLQLIATHLDKVDGNKVPLEDFLPHTTQDVNKLLDRLRGFLKKITNHHLRALSECYLMDGDFIRDFSRAPAGAKVHHAYIGGLLEHVVTMMDAAERLAPVYPEVDRDLLILGVLLHDSGKIRELTYGRVFGYSDEGQLLGHLNIGVEILHEKITQVPELTGEPFPRELTLRLKHMILSHHGSLEFGSPKVPMTPEAILLHAIDHFDSRMHMILRDIQNDKSNPGAWTPFNTAMQRRFYKGGASGMTGGADSETYD